MILHLRPLVSMGEAFDHRLFWLGGIPEDIPVSHCALSLHSSVMNKVGIRMAFQVSPQRNPTSHRESDLATLRRTVVFVHGQPPSDVFSRIIYHLIVSYIRRTRRRDRSEGQELFQPAEVQNHPLRPAWVRKVNSVRRYLVHTSVSYAPS